MNKVTTAALAGLLAVTAGAQASASRWNGLGKSDASAKAFTADVQDEFSLPGVVYSHPDTTYVELGDGQAGAGAAAATAANNLSVVNNAWGGVHSKLGGGVLGIWFNRNNNALGNIPAHAEPIGTAAVNTFTAATLTNTAAALRNQFEVIFGYPLSDATTLGFGISRGTNSTKTESVTTTTTSSEATASDFGINLGVEQKEVGPISLLEVGLQFNSRAFGVADKGATTTNKLNGAGSAINLRVGGDMAGENGMFSRVELGFNTQSLSVKAEPAVAPAATAFVESKNSATAWNLGYAMGGTREKGMGLFGLMLAGMSTSNDEAFNGNAVNKTDGSVLHLLASTAGEAKINNWLSFRAGLESDIFFSKSSATETGPAGSTKKVTTTNDSHAGTVADPNAVASMGVSVTLGDIIIDGVLNQGVLYSGTYLISGIPQGLSSQVSLTWPWGGGSKQ